MFYLDQIKSIFGLPNKSEKNYKIRENPKNGRGGGLVRVKVINFPKFEQIDQIKLNNKQEFEQENLKKKKYRKWKWERLKTFIEALNDLWECKYLWVVKHRMSDLEREREAHETWKWKEKLR